MRFWLSLMAIDDLTQLPAIARAAEQAGFHGVTFADHLLMPAKIASKYPYTEDGEMFWPLTTPWPDPWIALSVMGAATTRLHLATNIYLAALRDPFTAAKSVATTAAICGDRVACGVSAGWIKEEYEQAGIDFASRGRRLDEMLAAMRALWSGETVRHAGEFFNFEAIMRPAPAARVPIWVGGASKPALRRAAQNDGWLGLPMSADQNIAILDAIEAQRGARGLHGFTALIALAEPLTPSTHDKLMARGIGDVSAMPFFPNPWDSTPFVDAGADWRDLDIKTKALERFGETVIAEFT